MVTNVFSLASQVAVIFCFFWGGCNAALPQEGKQKTEIAGEVVLQVPEKAPFPEIAGKTLAKKNFPVYIFTWEESAAIRDWLKKREDDIRAADQDPQDPEKFWIAQKRTEDIYTMVLGGGDSRGIKTDRNGRFVFKNLKVGGKYLVIGAALEQDGITLLPQIVGPLSPGVNKVVLVDRW